MPTCKHCDVDVPVEDLVRHENDGLERVHCPNCERPLGTYRDPAGTPGPEE